MKEAKSIYRGGNIILSDDCDYQSSKKLGIVCPFCNEPLFLAKSSFRKNQKSGKEYFVNSHFKHYSSNEISGDICEKRAITKEGKEFIEFLRSESRNQRLKIFNCYLWEIIRDSAGYDSDKKNLPKKLRHKLNKGLFHKICNTIMEYCKQNEGDSMIRYYIKQSCEKWEEKTITWSNKYLVEYNYFTNFDRMLHNNICMEVVDFLGTKKAVHTLEIVTAICIESFILDKKTGSEIDLCSYAIKYFAIIIATTRWIEQIRIKENQKVQSIPPIFV